MLIDGIPKEETLENCGRLVEVLAPLDGGMNGVLVPPQNTVVLVKLGLPWFDETHVTQVFLYVLRKNSNGYIDEATPN